MPFKDAYPDYVAIEAHIQRAHLERSLAIAHYIAEGIDRTGRGLRSIAQALSGWRNARPVNLVNAPAAR